MSLVECIQNGTAPEDLLSVDIVSDISYVRTIQRLLEHGSGSAVAYTDGGEVNLQIVYAEGGSEGDGQYVERVLKATHDIHTAYWRVTASYDSWNGTEWDTGAEVVFPKEVAVTQYFTQDELSRR